MFFIFHGIAPCSAFFTAKSSTSLACNFFPTYLAMLQYLNLEHSFILQKTDNVRASVIGFLLF